MNFDQREDKVAQATRRRIWILIEGELWILIQEALWILIQEALWILIQGGVSHFSISFRRNIIDGFIACSCARELLKLARLGGARFCPPRGEAARRGGYASLLPARDVW